MMIKIDTNCYINLDFIKAIVVNGDSIDLFDVNNERTTINDPELIIKVLNYLGKVS